MFTYTNVKCLRVVDGDTIEAQILLSPDSLTIKKKLRLARIDTPELREKDGKEIKAYLMGIIQNKKLDRIEVTKLDGWGRWITEVYFDGQNISDLLLDNGMAVLYKRR